MKKICLLLMVGTLLLTGCKSSAVKNTETAINKIGEVTLDSKALIDEAQASYDALTDKQKDEVDNYKILKLRTCFLPMHLENSIPGSYSVVKVPLL